jgi:GH15 family glucan-1,4-alpha-glucosidase
MVSCDASNCSIILSFWYFCRFTNKRNLKEDGRKGEFFMDHKITELFNYLSENSEQLGIKKQYADAENTYEVIVHNTEISELMQNNYTKITLDKISQITNASRTISVIRKQHGTFIEAASFDENDLSEGNDETNYDAIWVRDSIWGYYSLLTDSKHENDAKEVLLTILKYFTKQKNRFFKVIENPELLNLPGMEGEMFAPHIRFNSSSPQFDDVTEEGKAQSWTHKQNDALGLTLIATSDAISNGILSVEEIGDSILSIVMIVTYLNVVEFENMPDCGAWEEQPARINTSSIALVTAGLERLKEAPSAFSKAYMSEGLKNQVPKFQEISKLDMMIDRGYNRIRKNIKLGGESPEADTNSAQYRTADAALYATIYPAKLKQLSIDEKNQILEINSKLIGEVGIRRYFKDNYQSGNFWFNDIKTDADPESMKKRQDSFIKGSEAQWFFDSWVGLCALEMYEETQNSEYLDLTFKHFNRSLSQITYGGDNKLFGANGQPIAKKSFPESYNTVISDTENKLFIPSPITPLNWAKGSFNLLLTKLSEIIE